MVVGLHWRSGASPAVSASLTPFFRSAYTSLGLLLLGAGGGCTEPKFNDTVELEDGGSPAEGSDDGDVGERLNTPEDARVGDRDSAPKLPGRPDAAVDSAVPPGGDAGAGDASVLVVDEPKPGSCQLAGTYAVRSDMEVAWKGKSIAGVVPLVHDGNGVVRIWGTVRLDGNGTKIPSEFTLCGAILPELIAGDQLIFGTERYGLFVPDAVWERETMPKWPLDWQSSCAQPGCRLTSDTLTATLGGENFDPQPTGAPAPLIVIDHDLDGLAALTVVPRQKGEGPAQRIPYMDPPLSWTTQARASKLFAVIQFRAQFNLDLQEGCDTFTGASNQTRVDIRTAGCHAKNTPGAVEAPCSAEQVKFLADNIPPVDVNRAESLKAVRVPDGTTCSAVREMLAD